MSKDSRPGSRDYRLAADLLQESLKIEDSLTWLSFVLDHLHHTLGSVITFWNEHAADGQLLTVELYPPPTPEVVGFGPVVARFIHQHPFVNYWSASSTGRGTVQTADIWPRYQQEKSEIYNRAFLLYRRRKKRMVSS